jgi:hypothetical protein
MCSNLVSSESINSKILKLDVNIKILRIVEWL